jgi:hypothetical protein
MIGGADVAEDTTQQPVPEGESAVAETPPPPETVRTPEQVEAEWAAKQSALGRQYAATEKALRDQIAALTAAPAASGATGSDDAIREENERLRKQLVETERAHTRDVRAARFPLAAEALEPDVLATMDEARLSGLEARLTPAPSTARVMSSTPPRTSEAPKPLTEKTSDELKADLARYAPDFLRTLRPE